MYCFNMYIIYINIYDKEFWRKKQKVYLKKYCNSVIVLVQTSCPAPQLHPVTSSDLANGSLLHSRLYIPVLVPTGHQGAPGRGGVRSGAALHARSKNASSHTTSLSSFDAFETTHRPLIRLFRAVYLSRIPRSLTRAHPQEG